jgi:Coenzyme PQQ synthesis protein D (PqqD)
MFSINVVGSQILDFIEHGWDESQIADEIARRYAVSGQTAATDVHVFIEALRKHRIVRAAPCAESLEHR